MSVEHGRHRPEANIETADSVEQLRKTVLAEFQNTREQLKEIASLEAALQEAVWSAEDCAAFARAVREVEFPLVTSTAGMSERMQAHYGRVVEREEGKSIIQQRPILGLFAPVVGAMIADHMLHESTRSRDPDDVEKEENEAVEEKLSQRFESAVTEEEKETAEKELKDFQEVLERKKNLPGEIVVQGIIVAGARKKKKEAERELREAEEKDDKEKARKKKKKAEKALKDAKKVLTAKKREYKKKTEEREEVVSAELSEEEREKIILDLPPRMRYRIFFDALASAAIAIPSNWVAIFGSTIYYEFLIRRELGRSIEQVNRDDKGNITGVTLSEPFVERYAKRFIDQLVKMPEPEHSDAVTVTAPFNKLMDEGPRIEGGNEALEEARRIGFTAGYFGDPPPVGSIQRCGSGIDLLAAGQLAYQEGATARLGTIQRMGIRILEQRAKAAADEPGVLPPFYWEAWDRDEIEEPRDEVLEEAVGDEADRNGFYDAWSKLVDRNDRFASKLLPGFYHAELRKQHDGHQEMKKQTIVTLGVLAELVDREEVRASVVRNIVEEYDQIKKLYDFLRAGWEIVEE